MAVDVMFISRQQASFQCNQGLSMVRKLGRFVEFSVFGSPATVDWSIIGDRKELDILGSHLSPYAFPVYH